MRSAINLYKAAERHFEELGVPLGFKTHRHGKWNGHHYDKHAPSFVIEADTRNLNLYQQLRGWCTGWVWIRFTDDQIIIRQHLPTILQAALKTFVKDYNKYHPQTELPVIENDKIIFWLG